MDTFLLVGGMVIALGAIVGLVGWLLSKLVKDEAVDYSDRYCPNCGTGPFPQHIINKRESGEQSRCSYCGELW